MTRPRVAVDMDHLLGAVATRGGDTRFLLDLGTGEIVLALSGDGEQAGAPDEVLRELPRWSVEHECEALRGFARGLRGPEAAWLETLLSAETGVTLLARLAEGLARYPVLQVAWQRARREALLAHALDWFARAGIDVLYEPLPELRLAGLEPGPHAAREDELDLVDLLLVGEAPAIDDPEASPTASERRLRLSSPEQARRLFRRVVAEWCLLMGEDPRRHHDAPEGGWQFGRLRAYRDGDEVGVTLTLSAAARRQLRRRRRARDG